MAVEKVEEGPPPLRSRFKNGSAEPALGTRRAPACSRKVTGTSVRERQVGSTSMG